MAMTYFYLTTAYAEMNRRNTETIEGNEFLHNITQNSKYSLQVEAISICLSFRKFHFYSIFVMLNIFGSGSISLH
jgi:hypothetical protein